MCFEKSSAIISLVFFEESLEKGRVRPKRRYKIKNMWEALTEAASKKKKCLIRYKKRGKHAGTGEYLVAPYSFRNKPGGEVLFAYDLVDGRIKSFFKDGVTGVHVTDRKFRPKWNVEVSEEKDLFGDLGQLLAKIGG